MKKFYLTIAIFYLTIISCATVPILDVNDPRLVNTVTVSQQHFTPNEQLARDYIQAIFDSDYAKAYDITGHIWAVKNPQFNTAERFTKWLMAYDAGKITGVVTSRKEIVKIKTVVIEDSVGLWYQYRVRLVGSMGAMVCDSTHAIKFDFVGNDLTWFEAQGSEVLGCYPEKEI